LSKETPLSGTLKAALIVAAVLVFVTALQLVSQSSHTDRYFAWTIKPPITAAFLAASYLSALVILVLAAMQRSWDRVRVAISPVLVFLPLMMIATLVHLDRFHLNAGTSSARVAGWGWLVLYAVVLVVIPAALLFQRGGLALDRLHARPLASSMRGALALQAAVLIPVGIGLFVAPGTFDVVWPWDLTPLTGRTVGAWFAAIGVGAVDIAWTNDVARVRIGAIAYAFFGVAEILAVVRYPSQVDWGGARTYVYIGFLAVMAATGVAVVSRMSRAALP
jgi:hypothetical protein